MRVWSSAVVVLVAGIVMASLGSRFIEGLIFQPSPGVSLLPQDLGIPGEEVFLQTEDGVQIHAFYLPVPGATRAVLFLHGNAGNASHRLPNAAQLAALGAHVLLLEYRGYGRSQGTPTESGVYADARAGLEHLTGERGIPESRIVLFGRSLGGAVAVDLAVDRALAGVVLESTFTSVRDVAKGILAPLAFLAGDRFPSLDKIPRFRSPVLFFHGDRDTIIPFDLGRKLFEAAPEPKAFEVLRGAGHNDTVEIGGRPYLRRIGAFLDEVAP